MQIDDSDRFLKMATNGLGGEGSAAARLFSVESTLDDRQPTSTADRCRRTKRVETFFTSSRGAGYAGAWPALACCLRPGVAAHEE
jgi:hypothetical protein